MGPLKECICSPFEPHNNLRDIDIIPACSISITTPFNMRFIPYILALMAFASSVTALGINCQGSSNCDPFFLPPAAALLEEIVAHVSDGRWYQNGQKIVCVNGRGSKTTRRSNCAFLQRTGGLPGYEIKKLARRIVDHGCKTCGSVPVFIDQGDNDVNSHGELTFNFVGRNAEGDGLCKAIPATCYYE